LGRPTKVALSNQVSPGERNPIEGKFGQAKTGYGLDRIKARLSQTSESWIASIILVLNLINLTQVALLWTELVQQVIAFFESRINNIILRFIQSVFYKPKFYEIKNVG
jgi:hypothetical protein